jgi:hypothetical protein
MLLEYAGARKVMLLPWSGSNSWIVSIVVSGNYTVFFDCGRVYSSLEYTPHSRLLISKLSTEYIRKGGRKVQLMEVKRKNRHSYLEKVGMRLFLYFFSTESNVRDAGNARR